MLDNVPYAEVIQPLESLKDFHLLSMGARSLSWVNGNAIALNRTYKERDRWEIVIKRLHYLNGMYSIAFTHSSGSEALAINSKSLTN